MALNTFSGNERHRSSNLSHTFVVFDRISGFKPGYGPINAIAMPTTGAV
jgi:hypothetical protein